MKKHLFLAAIAAVATFTGCSNEETLEQAKGVAIGFGKAFVNNSTRADEPASGTSGFAFKVWGFEWPVGGQSMVQIMGNGTEGMYVDKKGNYDNPRYWTKGSKYVFGGVAPAENSGIWEVTNLGTPAEKFNGTTFSFTNNGTTDFMTATTALIDYTAENKIDKVTMPFKHVLSKVNFEITNNMYGSYAVEISNLKISNCPKTGVMEWMEVGTSYTMKNYDENKFISSTNDGWETEDGAIVWSSIGKNNDGTVETFELSFAKASETDETDNVWKSEDKYLIPEHRDVKSNDDPATDKIEVDRLYENYTYNISFDVKVSEIGVESNIDKGTVTVTRTLTNPHFLIGYAYTIKTEINYSDIFNENGIDEVKIEFSTDDPEWKQNGNHEKNTDGLDQNS